VKDIPAESSFRSGHLGDALAQLQAQIRAEPQNVALRTFLAQLLIVMGQWQRAVAQLALLREMSAEHIPMSRACELLIKCEEVRADVFAGKRAPLVLGEPPAWIAGIIQALKLDADGDAAAAAELRLDSFNLAEAHSGTINGQSFEWIMDADSRLGPVLEIVLDGGYYWVPLERIHSVRMAAPEDIRDLVWIYADLTLDNEGQWSGFIPVRYPGTEQSSDDSLRLSRGSQWKVLFGDTHAGLGQRIFSTDQADLALLDVREIEFQRTPAPEIA
jgi:type VI secretion system protein ImpE